MKNIKDIFEYHDKWGIGGDCGLCFYCNKRNTQEDWPADNLGCNYHKIDISIELTNGYLNGQYFCKNMKIIYSRPEFYSSFNQIKDELEEDVLYEACEKEYLKSIPFSVAGSLYSGFIF